MTARSSTATASRRRGAASPEGLFKTLPTDRPARFAVVCCAKFNSGFFNAYRALAEMDDIDFVLHLGDYIYEAAEVPVGKQTPGANIGRPMDPLGTCVTSDDYDTRYREYRGDQDLLLLHSRHAMIATVDDHELSDNAWSGGADEHNPARDGSWDDRKQAALRRLARLDADPAAAADRRPRRDDHVWQEISLGEAGRILLCETRLARSDPAAADGPDKTELGAAQRDWLMSALETPVPGWTFLAMPSMLASVEGAASGSRCPVRPAQAEAHRRGCRRDLPRSLGRLRAPRRQNCCRRCTPRSAPSC